MGFCSDYELEEVFRSVPEFEKMLIHSSIILIQYQFSLTDDVQSCRFLGQYEVGRNSSIIAPSSECLPFGR